MSNHRQVGLTKTHSNPSNRGGSNKSTALELEGPEVLITPFRPIEKYPIIIQDRDRAKGNGSGERATSAGPRSRSNSASRRRIWNEMYADDTRQQDDEKPLPQPFAIPVSDVVEVETKGGQASGASPIVLTTLSMGYFEFTFHSSNAHDVFLAFFTNSLPYECIIHACPTPLDACSESYDVETLTATRMQKSVESETLTEKMMRKLNLMADRISECECFGSLYCHGFAWTILSQLTSSIKLLHGFSV